MNSLRRDLQSAREDFHHLLGSFKDNNLKRKSNNPGWTNGEILFHILLGFIVVSALLPLVKVFNRLPKSWSKKFADVLNFSTPAFNVFNAFGARILF